MKKVKIEVIETRGRGCDYGLKLGDVFYHDDKHSEICAWAQAAIFPFVQALQYGASFPFENEGNTVIAGCQDAYNTVVFKMTALDPEE